MIDWTNPTDQVSPHFTVHECLWLPTWSRLANEADGLTDDIKANIVNFFNNYMEQVRNLLGPMVVHVAYRPEAYNKLIGGAPGSAHTLGRAVDYHCQNHGVDEAKQIILQGDYLDRLNLRMEKNTPTWIHNDNMPLKPGGNRFFLP